MGKIFGSGRTLGFLKAPFAVISKVPSSSMIKIVGLARCRLTTLGLSILSTSLFPPQLQNLIQDILVLHFARISDTFMWPYNDGTCLVKSASKFLFHQQQVPLNKPVWNWIWALQCLKKIQIFF